MAVIASFVVLVAVLINVLDCSTDKSFHLKSEDPTGGYTINIDFREPTLQITHKNGLAVIDLTAFPTQNISQKLRDNNLKLRGIIIENCTLPDGDSFGVLFKHLGIENEMFSFQGINISQPQFSLDGRFSSGFEKVEKLTLYKSSIIKLNESVFESLTELTELDLMENNITEVNQNVFKNLKKLKFLAMSYNELKSLSEGMFDNQRKLNYLDLQENRLTNLTKETFRGLSALSILLLHGNAVSLMDDVFHHLSRLGHISLGSGNMKVPYAILANQSQLNYVSLEKINVVEDLQFSGLKKLVIESSKVMNLSGLSNIENLLLNGCGLSSLNVNSFKNLNTTKQLQLLSNNMSILVDGLFNGLTKLVSLQLSYNQLTNISRLVFRELESLIEIDLSYNILTTIHPNAFDNTKQLTTIRLENNRLSFIDEKTPFMQLFNLEILDLSDNHLTRMPDLVKLNKLKDLNLANNKISSVKFSEIRRYIISLNAMNETRHTFGDKMINIHLNGNQLKCDCGMFDFLEGTDQAQLAPAFSHNCDHLMPCYRWSHSSDGCPSECSCKQILDNSFRHTIISYKGKKLTKLPKIEFINSESIKLDISNNHLLELPSIDLNLNVTFIQASFNQISVIDIEALPSSLRGLDLSHNQFRTIAPDVLLHEKYLKNLEVFFLKNNPLECYCSSEATKQLIKFIDEKGSMTDLQNAKCNEHYALSMEALHTICANEVILNRNEMIVISLTSLTIVIIIFVVILLLFIKHHKLIKMWFYAHGWFLWWVDEEYVDREKLYDVFISYEHTNRMLAYRITYALEKLNIFKVCLHERDFPGGGRIEESVNNAVNKSRRTLVILSEDYLKSVWCEHEFHLAWSRCVAEKRKLIIAVKDGNLGNVTDKTIRSYIETHTYIESSGEWFFERLIFRMPHKRSIKHIFPIREWNVIPLDVNESNL